MEDRVIYDEYGSIIDGVENDPLVRPHLTAVRAAVKSLAALGISNRDISTLLLDEIILETCRMRLVNRREARKQHD